MKSVWDPHYNRIYFYLFNKKNTEVVLKDLNVPDHIEQARCNVYETLFCGESRFEEHPEKMVPHISGEMLDNLQYTDYEIFEQGKKPF